MTDDPRHEETLLDPTELAGTADAAIAAEFAARDVIEAQDAVEAQDRADALKPLDKDELPLEGN